MENEEDENNNCRLAPQNILEELKAELNLNLTDKESAYLANYISQAEMTDFENVSQRQKRLN